MRAKTAVTGANAMHTLLWHCHILGEIGTDESAKV